MGISSKYHVSKQQLVDEEVYIEAAKLDPAKFDILYNKYYDPVFFFVYQRLDDKHQAFEITSKVFLKALYKLDKFICKGLPFSSWLFRIARNELIDFFRKNKNERTVNVETAHLSEVQEEVYDKGQDEKMDDMIKAISGLEEDELLLIEMRYFEQRSFKEIGEILEITENNAKVKTYRLIEKLRKQLNA